MTRVGRIACGINKNNALNEKNNIVEPTCEKTVKRNTRIQIETKGELGFIYKSIKRLLC